MQQPANTTTTKPVSTTINSGQSGLAPHGEHLARMRARGKSNGEIQSWLHSQGVYSNLSEIAAFVNRREQQPPQVTAKAESSPLQKSHSGDKGSGGPPQASPALEELMGMYKHLLFKKLEESDTSDESLKLINLMMRMVLNYEQGKARLEHSARVLNIKESEQQLKARQQELSPNPSARNLTKVEASAKEEARQKSAERNYPSKHSGHAQPVAATRPESGKGLDQISPTAETDKLPFEPAAIAVVAGLPASADSPNHSPS